MAYIEPNTTVQFLNVPFDPDYENTMYWGTLEEQELWMQGKILLAINRNSYQRKSKGVIRVGWTADLQTPRDSVIRQLYKANYMRYRNDNFENKWFYAFVKQVEYINNNTVDVYYDIDVMQTWALDYNLLQCFVERQHTVTDDIGEHTVPEGLEHGEYFTEPLQDSYGGQIGNTRFEYTPALCLVTTFDRQGAYVEGDIIHGRITQGDYFSGMYFTVWPLTAANLQDINDTLEAISGGGDLIDVGLQPPFVKVPRMFVDGVVSLFMMPFEFAQGLYNGTPVSPSAPVIAGFDVRTNGSYMIGSHRARNKKLMCYPYNMIYINTNAGPTAEFRFEDFNNPIACQFNIWGNCSPNNGLMMMPAGYKGYAGELPDEMIQVNGFPQCAWSYDSYKAWVSQNAGTIGAGILTLAGSWASVLAPWLMGGTAGAGSSATPLPGKAPLISPDILDGFSPSKSLVGSTLAAAGQVYDHQRKPPQAGGNSNPSLTYQSGMLTFWYYRKRIKDEYAEIIDDYFDMYGYKINAVKVPNRAARPCYTYVKTIGCAVDGQLPADDAKKIQSIFDAGIRFWRATAEFGNYNPYVNPNEVTIGE